MKKNTMFTLVMFLVGTVQSAVQHTVEWTVSASSLVPQMTDIRDVSEMGDGTVCVLGRDTSFDFYVLLLDADGAKLGATKIESSASSDQFQVLGVMTKAGFLLEALW